MNLPSGSRRFEKLRKAVESFAEIPPPDLRYLQRGVKKYDMTGESSRARVITFLEQVYQSQAETLPDWRDSTLEDGDEVISLQLPNSDPSRPEIDGYYKHAALGSSPSEIKPKKKKGKHKVKKAMVIDPDRVDLEVRHLPPCQMVDIYDQMKAADSANSSTLPPVSFSCFWRTWCQPFPHLRIRPTSSHSMCGECSRYKALLKDLAHHLKARAAQRELYMKHLEAQYKDRVCYWSSRSLSRLRPPLEVVITIDSMDQMKYCYPRGETFRAKTLSTMNRPRAHVTGLLCHGHFILMATGEHCMPKDASSMMELLSHALTKLQKDFHISLPTTSVVVQADNTPREMKNVIFCKWASRLISHRSQCVHWANLWKPWTSLNFFWDW